MADMNQIVQVAVDAFHNNVTKYSQNDSMELLRTALVEANGGSTRINYKDVRDGKCGEVFALVEEILQRTTYEGMRDNDFFMNMVEERNLALGDQNLFEVEDSTLFAVADAADGTQGIRRQRLDGYTTTFTTSFKVVRIYEELNRVLSGQVDFNHFINKIAESMKQKLLNDIYTMWASVTAEDIGGAAYFPAAGAYDETTLLETIEHVEAAANGKSAIILGTKTALRNLAPSIQGNASRDDLYHMGYYGKFYGTNVVVVPQRHKINSTEFVYDNDTLTILAGDDKPIKLVREGESVIIPGDALRNRDLTQEYMYGEKYGLGLVLASNTGIGRYKIAA